MRKVLTVVLVLSLLAGFSTAFARGGPKACLIGCLFGPRAGYMHNEGVRIRTIEWISLVFYPATLIQWIDIWGGKTWSEIEAAEGLRASNFDTWHEYRLAQTE